MYDFNILGKVYTKYPRRRKRTVRVKHPVGLILQYVKPVSVYLYYYSFFCLFYLYVVYINYGKVCT